MAKPSVLEQILEQMSEEERNIVFDKADKMIDEIEDRCADPLHGYVVAALVHEFYNVRLAVLTKIAAKGPETVQ